MGASSSWAISNKTLRRSKIHSTLLVLGPTCNKNRSTTSSSYSRQECQGALDSFSDLRRKSGVPLALHKTVGPDTKVTFPGISPDPIRNDAQPPPVKIAAYAAEILCSPIPPPLLPPPTAKSLLGKLQFISCIIPTECCFLRRFHNATLGSRNPNRTILSLDGALQDLRLWLKFLQVFNGRGLMSYGRPISHQTPTSTLMPPKQAMVAHLAPISSKDFSPSWSPIDIQCLKPYPIFAIIHHSSSHLAGSAIHIYSDHLPLVQATNNHSLRNHSVLGRLRPLTLLFMSERVKFKALHIPGVHNTLCDKLSRLEVPLPPSSYINL